MASVPVTQGGAPPRGRSPADECVHCGFCLPTCPTWQNWQEEMDSPRGRIDLFRALEDGRVALSPAVAAHFDRCLGCMACLTACPSGVRYDHVIDRARVLVEARRRRTWPDRLWRALVFGLVTNVLALRAGAALLWIGRVTGLRRLARRLGLLRASRRLATLDALAPPRSSTACRPSRPPRGSGGSAPGSSAGACSGCSSRA